MIAALVALVALVATSPVAALVLAALLVAAVWTLGLALDAAERR